MDPDSPQPSDSAQVPATPETDEDAPIITSPADLPPQSPQSDTSQSPPSQQVPPAESPDDDASALPTGVQDAVAPVMPATPEPTAPPTAPSIDTSPAAAPITPSDPDEDVPVGVSSAEPALLPPPPAQTTPPLESTSEDPIDSTPVPALVQNTSHGISPIGDAATLERLGLAKRQSVKSAKLARILAYAESKGYFTSHDLRLALAIPKKTADRYLDELVAVGRLQSHNSGDSIEYIFVQ